MKNSKNWKKTAAAMMAAVMLTNSFTAPVMAHGHGSSHHSSRQAGVYCVYHGKTHKSKSKCKRYCVKHKTIHRNGKQHAVSHHAGGHH